jgi:hypothetical protein
MPSLKNMIGETGFVEIPVANDEPLIAYYRRGRRSPREQIAVLKQQRELQAMQSDGVPDPRMMELLVEMMAETIVSWNLTDNDGAPIPTTKEALLDVDMDILVSISQEIGRANTVDPLRNGGSKPGSSQTESSEPLRIISSS